MKMGFKAPLPPAASTIFSSDTDRAGEFSDEDIHDLAVINLQGTSDIQTVESVVTPGPSGDIDEKEFNDIHNSMIEWDSDDDTWTPDMDFESVSSSDDEDSEDVDEIGDEDVDPDYRPTIRVKTGGALKSKLSLDSVQVVSMEETVHDEPNKDSDAQTDMPNDSLRVVAVEDLLEKSGSIVYHSNLQQLMQNMHLAVNVCPHKDSHNKQECKAPGPFPVNIRSRGTAAVMEWVCPHGHLVWKWVSQPQFKHGMLAGDYMLAINILLSGNNYRKISLLFQFMKLGMVDRSSFYRIQDAFCVDTVEEFWTKKRNEVIGQVQSKGPVVVLGDARMDSPGFSAQYCTYTAMDNGTKQIISMVNIDKRQTMRNSVAMEKEGFIRTVEILRKELDVVEFCTDAHMQISALFSTGIYKDCGIRHTLDMWHGSKSLAKKIQSAGQQRGCKELVNWTKDICNHFWYCCKSTETYEEFFELWSGVLHHVTGEHEWALGACQHGPLPEDREKAWLKKGSESHSRLTELVLDARWLKNVHKFLNFRSTAELESFHNHLLMYASKRFSFTPPVYAARAMLAAIDYNYHINRPPKRKTDGSLQYGKVFNKKSRKWSLYVIKEDKDYAYIRDLQSAIIEKKLSSSAVPRKSKKRPDDPRQYGVLSGIPAPSTGELLDTLVSRGLGQPLPK
ncbi:uncharacterized protein [Paramisgurnus dabryanus]|uniref:uncharacterized protein n=1 Tax=Paramisgurnus dabryanus TaxID=90735 RepID=UPI0031F3DE11